ncbi:hypothetical protein OEZ85_005608 [Tetradesmus obliquus]|uniref:MLO-like protein n=1 Tax=Tetradesmus obliquus TaxID=3088 RepID=A0ABY8UEH1_TETOB|nr:hypothetical protein OEZ85_005608 [Tetradesmus obliquus]
MSGGGHEHIRGILETSPAAIALLIVFFLLVTLGFEKGLHHARQSLRRRKKFGLLAAVNNLSNELMLLAVATLFLTALEPALTQICIPSGNTMPPWLANVNGCACCLAKTKGVTACFIEDRQCPADFQEQCNPEEAYFKAHLKKSTTAKRFADAANATQSAANITAAGTPAVAHGKRRLAAAAELGGGAAAPAELAVDEAHAVCDGSFLESYEECDYRPGWAPVVTGETLEQVHKMLFVMAVVHILVSVLVLLLSAFKLWVWRRMGGGAAEDQLAQASLAAAAAAAAGGSTMHSLTAPLPAAAAAAAAGKSVAQPAAAAEAATAAGPAADKAAAADQANGLDRQHSNAAVLVVDAEPAAAAAAAGGGGVGLVAPNWSGRPSVMRGPLAYLREAAELVARQLLLLLHPTLTRQEYSVLRASFYLTHRSQAASAATEDSPHHQLSKAAAADSSHYPAAAAGAASPQGSSSSSSAAGLFGPYLLECMERDGSKTVGLGLPMWLLVLAFVLLSGAIGWATWLFLILAGGLLLGLNCALLTTARHMTRGGAVRAQQPGCSRWLVLHRPRLLLGAIKLLMFFLAFVISQSVFFAAFFGTESCFFSRTGFQKNPVPWWGIMLVDLCLLLSLALFTLPLYTITSHTLRVDQKLLQQIVQQRQQQGGGHADSAHGSSSEWEGEH